MFFLSCFLAADFGSPQQSSDPGAGRLSIKGQTVLIWGFAGPQVSVARTAQLFPPQAAWRGRVLRVQGCSLGSALLLYPLDLPQHCPPCPLHSLAPTSLCSDTTGLEGRNRKTRPSLSGPGSSQQEVWRPLCRAPEGVGAVVSQSRASGDFARVRVSC